MLWKKEKDVYALLDEDFLAALLEQQERTLYARISSLDINELPIEQIEGKVTGGNINLDGDSCVRRTCSLTMIADDVNINDYYWGLNTKFRLEVGVTNALTDPEYSAAASDYPEIVWFPGGTYYIASFNTSLSVNSYTISLSGKDKMCMLNGDLGGQLFASIDFGQEEYQQTIMSPINLNNITSSEQIMTNRYYCLSPGVAGDTVVLDSMKYYDENNKQVEYKFVESTSGTWCKYENTYLSPVTASYGGTRYQRYKLITEPTEIFTPYTGTYSKQSYYWQKSNNLYIIDNAVTATAGRQYFQLNTCYEIDYEYTKKQIPLEKIIRESIHTYAKEPYHNIIINDLDTYGLEQVYYRGDIPLLAFRDANTGHFVNLAYADQFCRSQFVGVGNPWISYNASTKTLTPGNIPGGGSFVFDSLTSETMNNNPTVIHYNSETHKYEIANDETSDIYTIAQIVYGMDIGYRITYLVYNGELISSIGETLTSVLDKIKNMLGDFEYFYDTDGRFIFQRKKTYVNTVWSQIANNGDETYVDYSNNHKKFSFNFEGNRLVTAVQNTPVLTNLKNDYVVWGKRKALSGAEVPIHARYAIDRKPTEYMSYRGEFYYTSEAADNPSDQYAELITGGNPFDGYRKQSELIPECLIIKDPAVEQYATIEEKRAHTLWYELKDWSYRYYLLTGAYPAQRMSMYQQNGGFSGALTFPDGRSYTCRGQLIIDFKTTDEHGDEITTTDGQGNHVINYNGISPYWSSSPFQHSYLGCGHTYTQFLQRYDYYPGMVSYIYNPQMPQEAIDADGGELRQSDLHMVDWRELIYQMAIDYFSAQGCDSEHPLYDKNGNEVLSDPDDFLWLVSQLNRDKYPNGYTGYEQYYTDMQGFWRQLYNPNYVPQAIYKPSEYTVQINKSPTSGFYTRDKVLVVGSEIDSINVEYYVSNYSNADLLAAASPDQVQYFIDPLSEDRYKIGWNVNVFENPESLR